MTKLEAVNHVLMKAGRLPVAALDTNGNSDVAMVERVIDGQELRIQSEGWLYNMRSCITLTPDVGTSKIAVPSGVIEIDTEDAECVNVAQVGGFLYDLKDNTDVFTRPLKCNIMYRFEFSCIPPPVRIYIADASAREYNEMYGVPSKRQTLEMQEMKSKNRARQSDTRTSDFNVLDTLEVRTIQGNRRRYYGGR